MATTPEDNIQKIIARWKELLNEPSVEETGGEKTLEEEKASLETLKTEALTQRENETAQLEKEKAQIEKDRAQIELETAKVALEAKRADLQTLTDNNAARKEFSQKIFALTSVWLFFVLIILIATGQGNLLLSDKVLTTLLTTSTITVLGFFSTVTLYLFNRSKKQN